MVINQAIEQARITFEQMKSYSIFRIAETIRIILFMTLSIVVCMFDYMELFRRTSVVMSIW